MRQFQGVLTAGQRRLSDAVVDAGVASQLATYFEKRFWKGGAAATILGRQHPTQAIQVTGPPLATRKASHCWVSLAFVMLWLETCISVAAENDKKLGSG